MDLLLAAYRSAVHPATGYSPNMMMFGREVNIPSDILYPFPRPEEPENIHEYVHDLRDKMEECYHIVRKNLKSAAERQKQDYDSRMVEYNYKKGDVVYKREGFGRKLDTKYKEPYIILKCHSPSVYEILGKKKKLVIHHDRLKKYETDRLPAWVKKVKKNFRL